MLIMPFCWHCWVYDCDSWQEWLLWDSLYVDKWEITDLRCMRHNATLCFVHSLLSFRESHPRQWLWNRTDYIAQLSNRLQTHFSNSSGQICCLVIASDKFNSMFYFSTPRFVSGTWIFGIAFCLNQNDVFKDLLFSCKFLFFFRKICVFPEILYLVFSVLFLFHSYSISFSFPLCALCQRWYSPASSWSSLFLHLQLQFLIIPKKPLCFGASLLWPMRTSSLFAYASRKSPCPLSCAHFPIL